MVDQREPQKKMAPEKARQGKLGQPVLLVLVAALILAAVAWFGAEMFGQSIDPQPDAATETPAAEPANEPAEPAN